MSELHLGYNAIGDAGFMALLVSGNLHASTSLDVSDNVWTEAALEALSDEPAVERFDTLGIQNDDLTNYAYDRWIRAPYGRGTSPYDLNWMEWTDTVLRLAASDGVEFDGEDTSWNARRGRLRLPPADTPGCWTLARVRPR